MSLRMIAWQDLIRKRHFLWFFRIIATMHLLESKPILKRIRSRRRPLQIRFSLSGLKTGTRSRLLSRIFYWFDSELPLFREVSVAGECIWVMMSQENIRLGWDSCL